MPIVVNQVFIRLIRYNHQIALDGECSHFLSLSPRKHHA